MYKKIQVFIAILITLLLPALVVYAVVQTLNGQTGQTQTFSNDTNVTITSANDVHTFGWSGILSLLRGGTGTSTFSNGGIVFSDSTKLTQSPNNLFWDDTNNRLGIGTTSPGTPLQIVPNSITSFHNGLYIGSEPYPPANTSSFIQIVDTIIDDIGVDIELLNLSTEGNSNAALWLTSGEPIEVGFGVVVDGLGTYSDGIGVPATILDLYTNHPLVFNTNFTARMIITADGNVGIGTTSPEADLHIDSTGADSFLSTRWLADGTSQGIKNYTLFNQNTLMIWDNDDGASGIPYPSLWIGSSTPPSGDAGIIDYSSNFLELAFDPGDSWRTGVPGGTANISSSLPFAFIADFGTTPIMVIDVDDNLTVGIGTTTATEQLTVVNNWLTTRVPLGVYGITGQSADLFQASVDGDTAPSFVIGSDGQVGIGTTNPLGTLQVLDDADSTVYIGDSGLTGCLAMADSDGVGISYITVNNGVLTATTTKPSICQ